MRTIKFRGKLIETISLDGTWVEGFYYQQMVYGGISHFILDENHEWLIDPETLGQYTGLRDCNDKEIYEGDIINTKEFGLCEVIHSYYGWAFRTELEKKYARDEYRTFEVWHSVVEHSSVLGNIHDNYKLFNRYDTMDKSGR